jgi:predicted XRE-type DNA-binding protein
LYPDSIFRYLDAKQQLGVGLGEVSHLPKLDFPGISRQYVIAVLDLGHDNADIEQFKAILAAEIIKALDRQGLSVRTAHERTRIAAADFSRIRNADLGRFTVDRLISIINRLGSCVEVKVKVRRAETVKHKATA